MSDYRDRLQMLMDAKGADITAVAEAVGVTYQAIRKVFVNNGALGAKNNFLAAKFFGADPEWLMDGDGEPVYIDKKQESKTPEIPAHLVPDLSTDIDKVLFNVGVFLSALGPDQKEAANKALMRKLLETVPGERLNEVQKALLSVLVPYLQE